ncbi:hypothetical protein LX16_1815 [Stackebrandtia albiflava]|uniref:DUF5709 domain-containing protein n=2 Tax=Stackebrandtia albiflava TaxID=406432 RepID=A0A562VDZ2_9ACTN|nr:hypothetical protein LX16_1815 [Stackebrandtia albiflava]
MDIVDDDAISEDELEDEILLADGYRAANSYGTTPEEAREGESLDRQLAAERPDTPDTWVDDEWRDGPNPRAEQLVADGEDAAVETGGEDYTDPDAEETAVHIRGQDADQDAELGDATPKESLAEAEEYTDLDQSRDGGRHDDYR